jgi:GTP-binding protein
VQEALRAIQAQLDGQDATEAADVPAEPWHP